MIQDTITNCLKIVGKSIALGKYPPAMQVISFDQHDIFTSIRQLYVLASLEANYSNHTYYDKTNSAGIPLREGNRSFQFNRPKIKNKSVFFGYDI